MESIQFLLNNEFRSEDINPTLTVLDYLRYNQSLVGTKIGCREGDCGACTILVGQIVNDRLQYENITSCLTPMGNIHGKHVVTIEGLNIDDLNRVQEEIVEAGGTQCGFCTVGFVVSLLGASLNFGFENIDLLDAIDGNICRCTGYKSIELAVEKITTHLRSLSKENWIDTLVNANYIPEYFSHIKDRLNSLEVKPLANTNQIHLGGGTDLYVQKYDQLLDLDVKFVNHEDLDYIIEENGILRIGGNITASTFSSNSIIQKYIPKITQFFKLIASQPIRNIATLSGNIVNASPIADFANILLALDASLVLEDGDTREVKLQDFFLDYKVLDKNDDEIIREIRFPVPSSKKINFEKVSKRTHLDIASVNSTIVIADEDGIITSCRIAAGGIAPIPLFLKETSEFLTDQKISYETIIEATRIADTEISPIGDIRGSITYKRLLLRQLLFAHFIELYPDRISEIRRLVT